LLSLGEVKKVKFVSSDEALAEFKERHQGNQTLMDSLNEVGNPLLPAINIEAQSAAQYDAIINFLEQGKYQKVIDKINYQQSKPLIEKLTNFSNSVKRTGIIVSIILSIIAGLVTFNTIRLAMYNFRDEVGVMRLVGADNWFIRGPFLVEGIIYGIISAVATLIIFLPLIYFLSPKISLLAPGLNIFQWFIHNIILLLLLQIAVGIILGGASSMVAIRKYLRV
jgi:cell division transport system permease protein